MAVTTTTSATDMHMIIAAVVVLLIITICHGGMVSAQAPGPSPSGSVDCSSELLTMADCLTYVEAGSNMTKPDKPCCPELAALVKNNPVCLCYLLQKNSTSGYGIEIDLNRALHLPTVCKVETPPTSTCALLGIPVDAPTASEGPAASPTGSELAPQLGPSGSTANTTDRSEASGAAKSFMAFSVGLAIAYLIPSLF